MATTHKLGFSQAYVAKRIAQLEKTLNVQLLHQTTKQVSLTKKGKSIYVWVGHDELVLDFQKNNAGQTANDYICPILAVRVEMRYFFSTPFMQHLEYLSSV